MTVLPAKGIEDFYEDEFRKQCIVNQGHGADSELLTTSLIVGNKRIRCLL